MPKKVEEFKNSPYKLILQRFLKKEFYYIENLIINTYFHYYLIFCFKMVWLKLNRDIDKVYGKLNYWFEIQNYRFPSNSSLQKIFTVD